uniref:Probable serine/threonine-protein kinase kinX n=1 Tax=Saccoglossus kowalevskii TaxID=10224 RepID=A0ABM0GLH8_SACKO|nr:PREDICTED: probable serine/threonine-protein kinase kinX [Saccoglossus kowalevskii]
MRCVILITLFFGVIYAFPNYYQQVQLANNAFQNMDNIGEKREDRFDKLIDNLQSMYGKLQSFHEEGKVSDPKIRNVELLPPNYTNTTSEIVKMGGMLMQKNTTVVKLTVNNSAGLAVFTTTNLLGSDSKAKESDIDSRLEFDEFIQEEEDDTSSSMDEFMSSSSEWMDEKADCVDDNDCADNEFCDNMGFWFWPNECAGCMGEDEICNRDAECCPGSLCVFGRCHADIIPGDSGTFCDEDRDCLDNMCCAYEPGLQTTVCKARGEQGMTCSRGRESFFTNIINTPPSECPCVAGLECQPLSSAFFSDTVCKRVTVTDTSNHNEGHDTTINDVTMQNPQVNAYISVQEKENTEEEQDDDFENTEDLSSEEEEDYDPDNGDNDAGESMASSWDSESSWADDEDGDVDSYLTDIQTNPIDDDDDGKHLEEELASLKQMQKDIFETYKDSSESSVNKVEDVTSNVQFNTAIQDHYQQNIVTSGEIRENPSLYNPSIDNAPNVMEFNEIRYENQPASDQQNVPIIDPLKDNSYENLQEAIPPAGQTYESQPVPYQHNVPIIDKLKDNSYESIQEAIPPAGQTYESQPVPYQQNVPIIDPHKDNSYESIQEAIPPAGQTYESQPVPYQQNVPIIDPHKDNSYESIQEAIPPAGQTYESQPIPYQQNVPIIDPLKDNSYENLQEAIPPASQTYESQPIPYQQNVPIIDPLKDNSYENLQEAIPPASQTYESQPVPYQQNVPIIDPLKDNSYENLQEAIPPASQTYESQPVTYQQNVPIIDPLKANSYENLQEAIPPASQTYGSQPIPYQQNVPIIDTLKDNSYESIQEAIPPVSQPIPYQQNVPIIDTLKDNSYESIQENFKPVSNIELESYQNDVGTISESQFESSHETITNYGQANEVPIDQYQTNIGTQNEDQFGQNVEIAPVPYQQSVPGMIDTLNENNVGYQDNIGTPVRINDMPSASYQQNVPVDDTQNEYHSEIPENLEIVPQNNDHAQRPTGDEQYTELNEFGSNSNPYNPDESIHGENAGMSEYKVGEINVNKLLEEVDTLETEKINDDEMRLPASTGIETELFGENKEYGYHDIQKIDVDKTDDDTFIFQGPYRKTDGDIPNQQSPDMLFM